MVPPRAGQPNPFIIIKILSYIITDTSMAATVSTISLAHLPPSHSKLYIALFTELKNGDFLRQQLLQGNTDFEYAFIDASTVVSTAQILAACFRAVNDFYHERLRSKNVHSEIVFALGSTNNIATSLKAFGVDSYSEHMLAVKVAGTLALQSEEGFVKIRDHLCGNVQGNLLPFTDAMIAPLTDWTRACRIYKLPQLTPTWKNTKNEQANGDSHKVPTRVRRDAETAIIGMIALRGS